MSKKTWVAIVVVVLFAAGVVAIWPRGGTPVGEHEVVTKFRRSSGAAIDSVPGSKGSSTTAPAGVTLPAPGVYGYATSGEETTKLGPFPAETRTFPTDVSASVSRSEQTAGAGTECFDYELNLIVEHVERLRFCARADKSGKQTLTVDSNVKKLKMGPATPEATFACEPKLAFTEGGDLSDIPCTLTLGGGPMEVKTEMAGSVTVGAPEEIALADGSVSARPVTVEYVSSGKVAGTWTEKIWFATSDWLPVRMERTIGLSGPANISENSQLVLKSLQPTT